jgi:transposase
MAMLADTVELARRVDTHKDSHTAAVVAATPGAVIAQATVSATPAGYRQLLALADQQPGQRAWAIEGAGLEQLVGGQLGHQRLVELLNDLRSSAAD